MKTLNLSFRLLLSGAFFCLPYLALSASDTNGAPAQSGVSQAPATPAIQYPYGVDDVVKLSRAQISEDIIVNFVQNSGATYSLSSKDIVNLKNEGVSDRVLNAMLDQKKAANQSQVAAAQQPAPAVANAPVVPDANSVAVAPTFTQPAPVYDQPVPAPASTVYVIPYPQSSVYYYGSYGYYPYRYYGPYCGYYGPAYRYGGYGHYYYHGHHH